jgi:hypothetical protein
VATGTGTSLLAQAAEFTRLLAGYSGCGATEACQLAVRVRVRVVDSESEGPGVRHGTE